LSNIEGLLKKVAESSSIEIRELEDEIQHDELLQESRSHTNNDAETTSQTDSNRVIPSSHTPIKKNHHSGRLMENDGFPLKTMDAAIALDTLMSIDEKAQSKVQRFFEVNKQFARDRFTKAFALFIKDEALIHMTWTGHREKYAFRSLRNIVEVMWSMYCFNVLTF
jgi:C4-type Zn-finger protein